LDVLGLTLPEMMRRLGESIRHSATSIGEPAF